MIEFQTIEEFLSKISIEKKNIIYGAGQIGGGSMQADEK